VRALLLCGYKNSSSGSIGLEKISSGETLIDLQIARLQQMGFEPVCVLSGQYADEQLRQCTKIAECELAFDTNDFTTLMTNLKAGLAATDGEGCFVLPLEIPCPEAELWRQLREEWRRLGFYTKITALQAMDAEGALWQRGFPLLITRNGNKLIRTLENLSSLLDPRLEFQHHEFSSRPELDSSTNPL
jgi:hypothetical protein